MSDPKELQQARIALTASIDADDIVTALNENDGNVLTFICQMLALSHSQELREQLLERLGVTLHAEYPPSYDPNAWSDEEYV